MLFQIYLVSSACLTIRRGSVDECGGCSASQDATGGRRWSLRRWRRRDIGCTPDCWSRTVRKTNLRGHREVLSGVGRFKRESYCASRAEQQGETSAVASLRPRPVARCAALETGVYQRRLLKSRPGPQPISAFISAPTPSLPCRHTSKSIVHSARASKQLSRVEKPLNDYPPPPPIGREADLHLELFGGQFHQRER